MSYDGTLSFDTKVDSSGFNSGVSKIGSLAKSAMNVTAGVFAAATSAIVGLGAASIKIGAEFEESMSKVEAISGATADELADLEAKAQKMGATTKYTATEAADAFSYMAMAGWKAEDMLDGIEGVMYLAAASGEDLALTSDIVTDALTAFGMKAEDAGHFADILAQASANSNTNVSLLGTSFKYVAPLCGAMGYSAEDCAVALGLMANAGIKSTMSGAALRNIFTNLSSPTNKAAEAMETLGLSLENDDGSMKSMMDVMKDLRKSFGVSAKQAEEMRKELESLDIAFESGEISEDEYSQKCDELAEAMYGVEGAERAALASALAGKQGMSGLLAIVSATDEDFNKLTDSIYNCDDAAYNMAMTMQDNLTGQVTLLMSAIQGLGLQIYKELETPLKSVVTGANEMIARLAGAFSEGGLQGLVAEAGECLSDIVLEASNHLPEIVDLATDLIHTFLQSIIDNKEEFGKSATTMITSLVEGFASCTGDLWSAGVYLLTEILKGLSENSTEIGYSIGVAIKQINDAIIENLPTIIECGKELMKGLIEGLMSGSEGCSAVTAIIALKFAQLAMNIASFVGKAIVTIGKIIAAIEKIGTVVSKVKTVLSTIGKFFSSTFGGIVLVITGVVMAVKNFIDMFQNGFNVVKEVLMVIGIAIATIGAIIAGVAALPAVIVGAIVAAVATLVIVIKDHWEQICEFFQNGWEKIKEFFQNGKEKVVEVIGAIVEWFATLPERIRAKIDEIKASLSEKWTQIKETVSTKVIEIIQTVVQFFSELPSKIGYAIGYVIGTLVKWGADVISWIITNVPIWIDNVITFFSELPSKIWTWLCNVVTNLIAWGSQVLSTMSSAVTNAIAAVITFFSELPGKVWTWLVNTITKVVTWASNLKSEMSTAATNAINAVISWFQQLPSKIWTWLTSTITKVTEFASNLKQKATEAASGFISNIVDGLKDLPGKMLDIGRNVVEGIWNGISGAFSWLKDKIVDFGKNIVDGFKDALDINSPSKVMEDQIGKWLPPGISVGFEKAMPQLLKDVDGFASDIVDEMQSSVDLEMNGYSADVSMSATNKARRNSEQVGQITYDYHVDQTNTYNTPVESPADISRAQRQAVRKLVGGVQ